MKVTKEFGYIPQQDTVNGGAFETQKHGYSKMLLSRTYFHQWHAHSPLWVYCLPTAIFILKRNITLWLSMTEYTYVSVSWHLCVCVCFPASLSVCVFAVVLSGHLLLELLIPPVLCPCCALICWYTWSVISLYAYSACWREILTLSKHRSLLLNISRAFTYQVSNIKGKFINTFTSVMWQLYSPWTLIGRRGT